MRVLAFDLGGTRLKAGIVDRAGHVLNVVEPVPVAGLDAVTALAEVERLGRMLLAESGGVDAIGLGVPGLVTDGRVHSLPGKFPGITDLDLGADLTEWFGAPATVVNDAIAYGAGEVTAGAGRGAPRVAVITIGTGVGCAVFENGQSITEGLHGGGILGGHLPVGDPIGPRDTAGQRGSFEARCRADRIVDEAREAGAQVVDVPGVYAAVAAGDRAAIAGMDAYRGWFARGLVAIIHAFTPDVIVVGGGPMVAGSPVLDGVADRVRELVWPDLSVDVRRAEGGDDASLIGVAWLAGRAQNGAAHAPDARTAHE
ncbi:MAG: glucokinase [Glaciecola sp.]|jgi:glucokinase